MSTPPRLSQLLVDLGERLSAAYILLSGSAKICVESKDGVQKWSANGSPTCSPAMTQNRVINASTIAKLLPGDIFGVELMVHKSPSEILLKVTEPSEMIVLKESCYRDSLGWGDLCSLEGLSVTNDFGSLMRHER